MTDHDFFVTSMPSSRSADYYLGYSGGCVFLDFDSVDEGRKICLKRISFDGYGCCELAVDAIPLDENDSVIFKNIVQDQIKDQAVRMTIIKRTIAHNKRFICTDALEEYKLI